MLFNSDTLSHIICIRINAPRWILFKRFILIIGTERERQREMWWQVGRERDRQTYGFYSHLHIWLYLAKF